MSKSSRNDQVISKERVVNHGEVFTSKREVNAMIDMVPDEAYRIDARFLEPACGTGNFLVEVLTRKLYVVQERYSKIQFEYERYAIIAIGSIYGVDILQDNVQTCRDRLLGIFTDSYLNNYQGEFKPECLRSAKYLLSKNILWGNALTLTTPNDESTPIIFSEWSAINGTLIKRRDFTLSNLLESQPVEGLNLFSDLGDQAFIPTSIGDFPVVHFLKLGDDSIVA